MRVHKHDCRCILSRLLRVHDAAVRHARAGRGETAPRLAAARWSQLRRLQRRTLHFSPLHAPALPRRLLVLLCSLQKWRQWPGQLWDSHTIDSRQREGEEERREEGCSVASSSPSRR